VANGYDEKSLKSTGLGEASSSSMPMSQMRPVAVRDKRFTRSGIGFRTQQEASTTDPGKLGQMPPQIMYPDGGYPGGQAARRRGMVDESKAPWETAQEATSPQIKPRDTLPPGMSEALPPWLKDKADQEKESAVRENWMEDDWEGEDEGPECEAFPDEEDAREALSTLSQFVDGNTLKSIQNQIKQTYGDPMEQDDGEDAPPVPMGMGLMGESDLSEAPLTADKRNKLPDSAFALPGRKYPIDTPERARSALSRVEQFGSDSDKAKVKAAVKKKYPNMKTD
jgi:hypothetical protein